MTRTRKLWTRWFILTIIGFFVGRYCSVLWQELCRDSILEEEIERNR